jgi:hypothetical protein
MEKNGGGHISKMQGRGAGSSCGSQYFTTIWPGQTTRPHDLTLRLFFVCLIPPSLYQFYTDPGDLMEEEPSEYVNFRPRFRWRLV